VHSVQKPLADLSRASVGSLFGTSVGDRGLAFESAVVALQGVAATDSCVRFAASLRTCGQPACILVRRAIQWEANDPSTDPAGRNRCRFALGVVQKTVPQDPLSPDELARFSDDSFCLPPARADVAAGLRADQGQGRVKSL